MRRRRRGIRLERCNAWRVKKGLHNDEKRALDGAERRKSQVRGIDFRELDPGRKTKRVQEPIFSCVRLGQEDKTGPRTHFSCVRHLREEKKFT